MNGSRLVAVPCRISGGVVPDERGFEIHDADGTVHSGCAPTHYFWRQDGRPLGSDEPRGEAEIPGWMAARVVERNNGKTLVSIPDGTVTRVASDLVKPRPSEVLIHVSVGQGS